MTAAENTSKRDPQLLTQLALSAWELEQMNAGRDDRRAKVATLRAHARLQAEVEANKGVVPAQRSRLRVRAGAEESVLLVHGSTGNPSDLSGLADHLYNNGYHVYNMLLPGHGTADQGLPLVKWKSCYNDVLLRYCILSRTSRRVHVVGFSFGAALALLLARDEKPASLSLLAAALTPKVPFWTSLLIKLGLHHIPLLRRKIGWNLEVFDAMEKAKGQVGKLRLPIYAAHCEDDDRIDPSSLRHLQKRSHNRASRFRVYQDGGHMILQAHGADSLHAEVLQFIRANSGRQS